MHKFNKLISVFLAFVMVITSISLPAQAVLAAENGRFTGNAFAVNFTVHSSWQSGYSAES